MSEQDDTIYRRDAIDAFKTVNLLCGLDGKGRPIEQDDLRCQITGTLLKVPPAQSQRKTGRWIIHRDWIANGECGYECSECGRCYDYDMNYCGYCGAKMEVKKCSTS